MHPSKAHQSTTKAPDSGLRLGFSDIKEKEKRPEAEATPSKSLVNVDGFEFKWNRPDSDLSSEAQRIMESVRIEAARIKEQMRAQRDAQAQRDEEADELGNFETRKIAKPRGKASRFSDIHKEEFNKMDSIANHGSLWKHSVAPVSLKRSISKTDIGDSNGIEARTSSTSPGKRVKKHAQDDVSTARPTTRDGPPTAIPFPRLLPSVITTPTKASLARSQSVKTLPTSRLPALTHSKSTKELLSPKTEGSNKYLLGLKKSASMKSILQKPQLKYSNDPVKIAAGTHIPIQAPAKGTPSHTVGTITPVRSPTKRVGFADEIQPVGSPSPTKIPTSVSRVNLAPIATSPEKVTYPVLDKKAPLASHPPAPSDFTFRAAKQINFGSGAKPTTTIRQVRPSGIPTSLAPFESLPAVPHGMPNKKRRRGADDDDDQTGGKENRENQPPLPVSLDRSVPVKKIRLEASETPAAQSTPRRKLFKGRRQTGLPSASKNHVDASPKKSGLSLSRLNFLARPKERT